MEASTYVVFLLAITINQAPVPGHASFVITPENPQVGHSKDVSIMCLSSVQLKTCEFNVMTTTSAAVTTEKKYELNQGKGSGSTSEYKYYGNGLENGQCGITFKAPNSQSQLSVGCRARPVKGEETFYAETSVVVHAFKNMPWKVRTNNLGLVFPGQKVDILFSPDPAATLPIRACRIRPPNGQWLDFAKGAKGSVQKGYSYFGSGLEDNQCGVSFVAQDKDNGWFWNNMYRPQEQDYISAFGITTIIVAKAPKSVDLITSSANLVDGQLLTATCSAPESRPVANIKWYLDGKVIRQDDLDDSPSKWRWAHDLQSISQTVKRKISWEDHAKVLSCEVYHPAIAGLFTTKSVTLTVKYSPQHYERPISYEFVLEEPGVANVQIFANPKPSIAWILENVEVGEGAKDKTGNYEGGILIDKGKGEWLAKLFIAKVSVADLYKKLYVKVTNTLGTRFVQAVTFEKTEAEGKSSSLVFDLQNSEGVSSVQYKEGDSLTGTCIITSDRPLTRHSWFIGDKQIKAGLEKAVIVEVDQGSYVIKQEMKHKVTWLDDKKTVECTATFASGVVKKGGKTLEVQYAPRGTKQKIVQYGLELDRSGVVIMEIFANPKPVVTWKIRDLSLRELESDESGSFDALRTRYVDGKWQVRLYINQVTQVDIAREVKLIASNAVGQMQYTIELSLEVDPEVTASEGGPTPINRPYGWSHNWA